jgi:hypothetical protein
MIGKRWPSLVRVWGGKVCGEGWMGDEIYRGLSVYANRHSVRMVRWIEMPGGRICRLHDCEA